MLRKKASHTLQKLASFAVFIMLCSLISCGASQPDSIPQVQEVVCQNLIDTGYIASRNKCPLAIDEESTFESNMGLMVPVGADRERVLAALEGFELLSETDTTLMYLILPQSAERWEQIYTFEFDGDRMVRSRYTK